MQSVRRVIIRAALMLGLGAVAAGLHADGATDPLGERTGGATTAFANGRNAFSFPFANLSDDERTRFAIGNSFFRRNWVEAPSSTRARDGLGPLFIARSCGGCHVQDGRGAPPELRDGLLEPSVALLLRLSIPGKGPHGGPLPDPVYGDQIANAAVRGVAPEARIAVDHVAITGRFADGTPYMLQQPVYRLESLGYGPAAPGLMLSPRIAPQLAGVGLIDAIPVSEIERNAREQSLADGPVKGQVNQVWDAVAGAMRTGRFGWKANVATLAHQSAAAFSGDMGITSSLFPNESCTSGQRACLDAPRGAAGKAPEIDDVTLANVVFYQSTLAPAARRNAAAPQVRLGQQLFARAQCAACHRPSYQTGPAPTEASGSVAVAGQHIWPYTDLLLHDMGAALADGRPDFAASGAQWRTPPLWGIGLIRDVNGHQRLLHDGRANGTLEAILWHAGEAAQARDQVLRMDSVERAALVAFVDSL